MTISTLTDNMQDTERIATIVANNEYLAEKCKQQAQRIAVLETEKRRLASEHRSALNSLRECSQKLGVYLKWADDFAKKLEARGRT